ncbi:MAG: Two-component system-sensor histidine kinase [Chlorobi bacterium]|nr:Two-component system-sensor histidine kinase [Chlorobiota bacterium]
MDQSIEELQERLAACDDAYERIPILNELGFRLHYTDPRRAIELAREALASAERYEEPRWRGESHRVLGICNEVISEFTIALEHLSRALTVFRNLKDRSAVAATLNNIGATHYRMGDIGGALKWYTQSLALCEELGDGAGIGRALSNLGTIYVDAGELVKAQDAYLRALEIYRELGEERIAAMIVGNLGTVFLQLRDFDRSIEFFGKSLDLARAAGDAVGEANALANMGVLLTTMGRTDEALEYAGRALEIHERFGDRSRVAIALDSIGRTHLLRGDLDAAFTYFNRSLAMATEANDPRSQAWALARIGDIQNTRGLHSEALLLLDRALPLARDIGERTLELGIHASLTMVHEGLGDLAAALASYRIYNRIREDVRGEERQREVAEMRIRFDVERAEKEREIYRLQNEQLQLRMEQKEKELTALALQLVQKNKFLDTLKKRLVALEAGKSGGEVVERIRHEIDANIGAVGEWETFERQFEQVHPDFVRSLSERYSLLTPTELKLCSLMKISLSTKEMANLLCLSVRNIENHRYRIRKKLGLGPDANLGTFLASLG